MEENKGCNFVRDMLGLGIQKIRTFYRFYAIFAPYLDEILYILTVAIFLPKFKFNLLPHFPKTNDELFRKNIFIAISITGIIAHCVLVGQEHNDDLALIKGGLYCFFSIILSGYILPIILHEFKTPLQQILIGFLFLYVVEFVNSSVFCGFIKLYNKYQKSDNQESEDLLFS